VLDGPINGVAFLTSVEQVLVPTLAPGDVVVVDTLGSHKNVKVRAAIRKAGAAAACPTSAIPDECAAYLRNSGYASIQVRTALSRLVV
jgi:hypothetical protein